MKTAIFKNRQKELSHSQVVNKFAEDLQDFSNIFSNEEIEMLAEAYAKNPVDKFIITEFPTVEAAQGDILIWAKGTKQYNEHIKTVSNLKKTNRLVLQEGDSMTGDHRVVPLEGSSYTLKTGTFNPSILASADLLSGRSYKCLILDIDKPFLVVHREHGNIALPSGEYMFCSALDSETMTRMLD